MAKGDLCFLVFYPQISPISTDFVFAFYALFVDNFFIFFPRIRLMKKHILLTACILQITLLIAQEAFLAGDGIAVFTPKDYDVASTPPSMALITKLKREGDLPAEWNLKPQWSTTTEKYKTLDEVNYKKTMPIRYRSAFMNQIKDADLYGTGEQLGSLRRNDTVVPLFNRDNFTYQAGPNLYQSQPWVMGVRKDGTSFGIIADVTTRGEIDLRNGNMLFDFEGHPFRMIVIERSTPQALIKTLAKLTGTLTLPPKWALGYQQCRYSYMDEAEGKSIIDNFRNRNLPCDVIWFDIDYMDAYKVFTFDKGRFPDPKRLNDYAHGKQFHTVWMIDPGVKVEDGYFVYDQLAAKKLYVRKPPASDNAIKSKSANVKTSASSNQDRAGNAVDGKLSSSWAPAEEDAEPWIVIDAGGLGEILNLDIIWLDSYAAHYEVLTSRDGHNWEFFAKPQGVFTAGKHRINGSKQTQARYLKILCKGGPKHEGGYQIDEVFLNGESFKPLVDNVPKDMFTGTVWPGRCAFPDFTSAKTAEWWASLYNDFIGHGIDGVWNDMNEPAVFGGGPQFTMPDDAMHAGGAEVYTGTLPPGNHVQYHNVYGMLMAKATRNGVMQASPNKRPFVLSRANFLGGHRYAATWTGDNKSSFEHMRLATRMCLSLGLTGQAFTGPDLGGFSENATPELFAQWIGVGAFYPFMRGHSSKGTARKEPWTFGEKTERSARIALERRYRLLPYLYTAFYEASISGLPVMRPTFFADITNPALRNDGDRFLFGGDIMIVPFWTENYAMPKGNWKAFYIVWGDMEDPNQPRMLLRAGAVVPVAPVAQSTQSQDTSEIILYVNLDENGEAKGKLYQDAGDGWAYKKGEYRLSTFTVKRSPDGKMDLKVRTEGDLKTPESKYKLHVL